MPPRDGDELGADDADERIGDRELGPGEHVGRRIGQGDEQRGRHESHVLDAGGLAPPAPGRGR